LRERRENIPLSFFTGLKSGEKLHEELFYSWESYERSAHEKIFVRRGDSPPSAYSSSGPVESVPPLAADIEKLITAARQGATGEVQAVFRRMVPEYVAGDEGGSVQKPEVKGIEVPAGGGKTV
jgi:FlaA1/EpsC-like NDP-sugar epimerase